MANYDVLKDVLALVKEDLTNAGPENGVGYTMPDGKYHIYIYVDVIDDEKVYVMEPNRVEDGAHEPFVGDTYIVSFEDYAEFLLGCEWCIKQFEEDLELQLRIKSEELRVNEAFRGDEKQVLTQVNEIGNSKTELEFTGLINGKYEVDDFYNSVDSSARYLLGLSSRNPEQSERIYEVIKDKVRAEAVKIQEGKQYHIDDTDVAHALGNVMEKLFEKVIDLEQIGQDKITVLTQANAVGDPRIEFDLGAVKLVAEPNCDKDYKEIIVGLVGHDGAFLQDLAVVGPEYTYDQNEDFGKPVLDEKKIAVRVYSDKDNEDYTHKFTVGVYEEPEVVHKYHGMKIFEKDGRFAVGSVNNSEFDDCTLENLQVLADESEMVEYCREHGIQIEFVDLRSNDKNVSFERYQEHISKFRTGDDSFLDYEFIVPCAYFNSFKQAMEFVDFASSERTRLGQKWSVEGYVRKGDKELFDGPFKYWSNALGELHTNANEEITVDELPTPLKRAYNELWSDGYSSLCYLVETADGYGVALVNEYDEYTASVKECTMDELFSSVQADKEKVMKVPYYQNAKVYAGDYTGFNECHELIVVFPADTPFEEFHVGAMALECLLYDSPVVKEKTSLGVTINSAEQQKNGVERKVEEIRGSIYEL